MNGLFPFFKVKAEEEVLTYPSGYQYALTDPLIEVNNM